MFVYLSCKYSVFFCPNSLLCVGLGAHVFSSLLKVLLSVPFVPVGIVGSVAIIFGATRIWSLGESIIKKLVSRNLTSAALRGDPVIVEVPSRHRLEDSKPPANFIRLSKPPAVVDIERRPSYEARHPEKEACLHFGKSDRRGSYTCLREGQEHSDEADNEGDDRHHSGQQDVSVMSAGSSYGDPESFD